MDALLKAKELKEILRKRLLPLIDNDYVLWGLPYYRNIGDVLIWEGIEQLLVELPYKCIGRSNSADYHSPTLDKDTIILITGGGYFGDIWRDAMEFALEGIKNYKENKIIFLPISAYYKNKNFLTKDSLYLSAFSKLHICTRDEKSYLLISNNFQNTVSLLPDMAFGIDPHSLSKYSQDETNKTLYLKRTDHELKNDTALALDQQDHETRDWPHLPMDCKRFTFEVLCNAQRLFFKHIPLLSRVIRAIINNMAIHYHRPETVKLGVSFLTKYKYIYTTRLHTMILALLLNKEVVFIDNLDGKISALFNTWLKDIDSIQELKP